MEPVHILFLIDVLYSIHGGAEGVLWKMTRLLPPDRYRCSVATLATHAERVVADRFSCPVYRLPIRRTYGWNALQAAFRLARLIRLQRVSIVHTFFQTSDLFGGIVARLSGCPILVSSRRDMGYQRSAKHRMAYRLTAGMFDQVHAVCDCVRLYHVQQDRLDPGRVVTVYNGVDLEEFDQTRNGHQRLDPALESASHLVACVANIRPVKAIEELVSTAAIVCRELPDARFVVAGAIQDFPYMQSIRELARQLGVAQKIIFLGASTTVPALLRQSDVFYLPSRSEGLSNAMLEAMASALPCVATDVGGNRELIESDRNGYLVPFGDAAAVANRILTLLRDRPLAQRMGQAGRQVVEARFSVQAMICRLVELYDGLLGRPPGGGITNGAGKTKRELCPVAD